MRSVFSSIEGLYYVLLSSIYRYKMVDMAKDKILKVVERILILKQRKGGTIIIRLFINSKKVESFMDQFKCR